MDINYLQLALGFGLAIVLALISYRTKSLNFSGTVGMVLIGTVVFGLGGWIVSMPLLFFFFSSVLLSKLKSKNKSKAMATVEKGGTRDFWQVLANGGIASICLIVYFFSGNQAWLVGYMAALCEASADTWATEIGTIKETKTVSIVTFKSVIQGQSGGVSWIGTRAAILGAMLTAASSLMIIDIKLMVPHTLWLIASAGFAGCLIDSILGATIQAGYVHPETGRFSESKRSGFRLRQGLKFINNDAVNFLGTVSSAGLGLIFF